MATRIKTRYAGTFHTVPAVVRSNRLNLWPFAIYTGKSVFQVINGRMVVKGI